MYSSLFSESMTVGRLLKHRSQYKRTMSEKVLFCVKMMKNAKFPEFQEIVFMMFSVSLRRFMDMFLMTFLRRAAQKRLLRLTGVKCHRLHIKSYPTFDF